MRIKRDKRDAIFSLLIRERAGWRCECCGKQFERGAQNLHCSHLFGRRHRSTRWAENGAVAHCAACHFYLTEHPVEFAEWIEGYLGNNEMQRMRLVSQVVAKFSKRDLENIYRWMKAEYGHMLDRRKGPGCPQYVPFKDAPEIAALERKIA